MSQHAEHATGNSMGALSLPPFGEGLIKNPDSGYVAPESESVCSFSLPTTGSSDCIAAGGDEDPNAPLASELHGKVLWLPASTITMFGDIGWPIREIDAAKWTDKQATTYAQLLRDTDAMLDRALADTPELLSKAKACDFALFNFAFYPPTDDYDALYTASLLTTWLFIWDDQVDAGEGSLANDFARACAWRADTISRVAQALGLVEPDPTAPSATGPMVLFAEFGRRAATRLNQEQLHRVRDEIVLFIRAAEVEQAQRLAGYVPGDVNEYLALRMHSSAVYPCFLALELFSGVALPPSVMASDEMRAIMKEGNYLISVHNDILSPSKEIASCCLINVVPVMFTAGMSWDAILPRLDAELYRSCQELDRAAETLIQRTMKDSRVVETLSKMIQGVRHCATGNLSYSLVTRRYRAIRGNCVQEDGSVVIVL